MMNATTLFAKLIGRPARPLQSKRKSLSHRVSPHLECLENRTLLSIVLTNEHTDLDVTYSDVDGRLHLAENNKSVDPIEYYPAVEDDKSMRGDVPVTLEFLPEARRPQTSDPRFAFTGVAPGDPVWIVPIAPRDPRLLQLGVSAERLDSDILAPYHETDSRLTTPFDLQWIKLTLMDVRGPGYFSVWQTEDTGDPTVWIATAGNPQGPDLFFTIPGGHVDYNWAFSQPGIYEVDFQASAFLADMTPVQSYVTTYHFQVDDVPGNPTIIKNIQQLDPLLAVTSHLTAENPPPFALQTPNGTTAIRETPGATAADQAFVVQHQGSSTSNAASAERLLAGEEASHRADVAGKFFDAVIF
jgi:surface-anchored protein